MTRINVVPPSELCRQHLLAEYRELPRVFRGVRKAQARGAKPHSIAKPASYKLGRGHVLFFYDKLGFLIDRQRALIAEMLARGYSPSFVNPDALASGIDAAWLGQWRPDAKSLAINRERIRARLPNDRRK